MRKIEYLTGREIIEFELRVGMNMASYFINKFDGEGKGVKNKWCKFVYEMYIWHNVDIYTFIIRNNLTNKTLDDIITLYKLTEEFDYEHK